MNKMTYRVTSKLDMKCVASFRLGNRYSFVECMEEAAKAYGFQDWAEMVQVWDCFVTVR